VFRSDIHIRTIRTLGTLNMITYQESIFGSNTIHHRSNKRTSNRKNSKHDSVGRIGDIRTCTSASAHPIEGTEDAWTCKRGSGDEKGREYC